MFVSVRVSLQVMWYDPILKEVVFLSDTGSSFKICARNTNKVRRKSAVLGWRQIHRLY